nr:MAG TPA_asm: hypothetical protein [Caudoviricetes sp.]
MLKARGETAPTPGMLSHLVRSGAPFFGLK